MLNKNVESNQRICTQIEINNDIMLSPFFWLLNHSNIKILLRKILLYATITSSGNNGNLVMWKSSYNM